MLSAVFALIVMCWWFEIQRRNIMLFSLYKPNALECPSPITPELVWSEDYFDFLNL